MTPRDLIQRWRTEAELLEQYGSPAAEACRRHAADLEAALRDQDGELLDPATAAQVSGYSVDRLRHLVGEGKLENVGRSGVPRYRRGDLPKKRAASDGGFDPAARAREVLSIPRPKRPA